MTELAKHMLKTRIALGLSQAEMARKLGLARQNYWRIEAGQYIGTPQKAARIARFAGLDEMPMIQAVINDKLARDGLRLRVVVWRG
jgi:transcriptional regulator with XRE-family HTH domain